MKTYLEAFLGLLMCHTHFNWDGLKVFLQQIDSLQCTWQGPLLEEQWHFAYPHPCHMNCLIKPHFYPICTCDWLCQSVRQYSTVNPSMEILAQTVILDGFTTHACDNHNVQFCNLGDVCLKWLKQLYFFSSGVLGSSPNPDYKISIWQNESASEAWSHPSIMWHM